MCSGLVSQTQPGRGSMSCALPPFPANDDAPPTGTTRGLWIIVPGQFGTVHDLVAYSVGIVTFDLVRQPKQITMVFREALEMRLYRTGDFC